MMFKITLISADNLYRDRECYSAVINLVDISVCRHATYIFME